MGGFNPPSDRRLFFLWLVLGLVFFWLYYAGPQALVKRFEKAYYSFYWNRPIELSAGNPIGFGIVAPQHVSSLVETELWLWVEYPVLQSELTQTATPARPLSPVIVIDYEVSAATVTPTPTPTATSDPAARPSPTPTVTPSPLVAANADCACPTAAAATPTPTPTATGDAAQAFPTVEAAMMFRQGDNRIDLNTDSQGKVVFTNLYPHETAAEVVWTRLMPLSHRQPDNRPPEFVFLGDENVIGRVDFHFYLWPDGENQANYGAPATGTFSATIDASQTVLRGLVRTLLLPPWANGVLIALALLCASLLNNLPHAIEQRLRERSEAHQKSALTAKHAATAVPATATEPRPLSRWRDRLGPIARTHPITLVIQFFYWLGVIALTVYVVLFLTERLILCRLLVAGWNTDECRQFGWNWWPALLLLTVITFYGGYLLPDRAPGSFHETVMHACRSSVAWLRNKLKPQQDGRQQRVDNLLTKANDLHHTMENAVPPFALQQYQQSYDALMTDRQELADIPAQELDERLSELRRWLDEMERYTALKNEFDALRPRANDGEAEAGAALSALRTRLQSETFASPPVKGAAEAMAARVRQAARKFTRRGEMERYTALKNEFDALRPKAKDGDAEAGAALTDLRARLESETFTSRSVKKAAEAMANDIDRAARDFAFYFEKPCQLPAHEATLLLQALAEQPVRFFTSPDIDVHARAIMPATAALPIAAARAESAMFAAQQQLSDAETDLRRILAEPKGSRRMLHHHRLKLTLAEWPNGLSHWHDIAPQGQAELATRIAQLQEDVRAAG